MFVVSWCLLRVACQLLFVGCMLRVICCLSCVDCHLLLRVVSGFVVVVCSLSFEV